MNYKPRTKAGSFYRKAPKHHPTPSFILERYPDDPSHTADFVQVHAVYPDPFVKDPGPGDWYIVILGTLTWGDVDGPDDSTSCSFEEMKLHEFQDPRAHWKKFPADKLPPKWKAFFDRNPIEPNTTD